MSGSLPGSSIKAEPNLTPILDMVFQLITFFMLVINFKSAELDMTLKLPVVGSARPQSPGQGQSLMVLNLKRDDKHPDGYLYVYGRDKDGHRGLSQAGVGRGVEEAGVDHRRTSTARAMRAARRCR